MQPPAIVNITRLHRETASVVRQAAESNRPVYVTQFASVIAVVLPRRLYDRLLRAAEPVSGGAVPDRGGAVPEQDGPASGGEPAARADASVPDDLGGLADDPALADPLAVFGPLPPGTLFEGPWGRIGADLAAFYLEEGIEVKPILRQTGRGAG